MPPCVRIRPSSTVSSPGPTCFQPVRSLPLNNGFQAPSEPDFFSVVAFFLDRKREWKGRTSNANARKRRIGNLRILAPPNLPPGIVQDFRSGVGGNFKVRE